MSALANAGLRCSSETTAKAGGKLIRLVSDEATAKALLEAVERKESSEYKALKAKFEAMDLNKSGGISKDELCHFLEAVGFRDTKGDHFDSFLEAEFAKADTNSDGTISFAEFMVYHDDLLKMEAVSMTS
eukprot:g207.t1